LLLPLGTQKLKGFQLQGLRPRELLTRELYRVQDAVQILQKFCSNANGAVSCLALILQACAQKHHCFSYTFCFIYTSTCVLQHSVLLSKLSSDLSKFCNSAPGPCWGLRLQTPVIGLRSALAMCVHPTFLDLETPLFLTYRRIPCCYIS